MKRVVCFSGSDAFEERVGGRGVTVPRPSSRETKGYRLSRFRSRSSVSSSRLSRMLGVCLLCVYGEEWRIRQEDRTRICTELICLTNFTVFQVGNTKRHWPGRLILSAFRSWTRAERAKRKVGFLWDAHSA